MLNENFWKVHPSSNGVFVDMGSQMAFIPPFYTKEEPYGPGFFLFNFNVILAIIHKNI